jgi:hypothetical protein
MNKIKTESKLVFNRYWIHHYEDGTMSFGDYEKYFYGVIDCLTYGRARLDAEEKIKNAQNKIQELEGAN